MTKGFSPPHDPTSISNKNIRIKNWRFELGRGTTGTVFRCPARGRSFPNRGENDSRPLEGCVWIMGKTRETPNPIGLSSGRRCG